MDPAMLSTVPKDRLELMLRVLQESRMLVEAEAKKNEEIRRAREIELAIESIKQQMSSKDATASPATATIAASVAGQIPASTNSPGMMVVPSDPLPVPLRHPSTTPSIHNSPQAATILGSSASSGTPVQSFNPLGVHASSAGGSMHPQQTLGVRPPAAQGFPFPHEFSNEFMFSGDIMIQEPIVHQPSLAERFTLFERMLTPAPQDTPHPNPTSLHPSQSFPPTKPTATDANESSYRQLLNNDGADWLKDLMLSMSQNEDGSQREGAVPLVAAAAVAATMNPKRPMRLPLDSSPSIISSSNAASSEGTPTPSPKLPIESGTPMDTDAAVTPTPAAPSAPDAPPATTTTAPTAPVQGRVDPHDHLPSVNLTKTSLRRRCRCRECATGLCLLILHADTGSEGGGLVPATHYAIDVTCIRCYGHANAPAEIEPENVRARGRKRRVNVFGRDRPMRCEACGVGVGFGGVRMVLERPGVSSGGKEDEAGGVVRDREWVEPRFGVEVVCDQCVQEFDFCTQCGGGGSHRTGKWRPRQLFKPGRRTCTLTHTRVGDLESFHAVSYRCPWDRLPEFMPDASRRTGGDEVSTFDPEPVVERHDAGVAPFLRIGVAGGETGSRALRQAAIHVAELHSHAYLTYFAIPAVMRMVEFLGSWDRLNERFRCIHEELDMLIMGGHRAASGVRSPTMEEMRRFCAVAHVLRNSKSHGGKKKGRGGAAGPSTPSDDPSDGQIMAVGVTTAQWSIPHRHVLLALGVVLGNSSLDKPGSMTHTLHTCLVRRIHQDCRRENLPPPLHVWTLYRRRLSGVSAGAEPELMRAGFSPLDEYCARWGVRPEELAGTLESWLFDNNFLQWNYTVFVARWEDLKWTWGVRDV
ncbi:hypothetical protein HDU96_007591 [Phlyctochytrium bullatum]|nr:hypothetical protein HDU96_007591 [Phlyctochytrium bullatum]